MIPDWTVGSTSTGCIMRFSLFTHTHWYIKRKGLDLISWEDEMLGVWVSGKAESKMISGTVGPR